MSAIPLTAQGAQRLQVELHRLKTVERPDVINAIAEARALEGRISELEGTLSNAQIIEPATLDAEGRIVFGATVEIEELESGNTVTYQIVGDVEADIRANKISISSPVARALIGKSAGDVVEVKAPAGIREYEILTINYV